MKQAKHLLFVFLLLASVSTYAQNVGIGTTTPPAKLAVLGSLSNPSIPGAGSTGTFRIGVLPNEGIDFGKMGSPAFAGWIQAGFNGTIADPLSLQPSGGNVGIGTTNPGAKLEVAGGVKISDSINIGGQLRITNGSPGAGKVLTSDADGLASWLATTSGATHTIGESYGGGIVFYVYDNGQHGLIAATADQSAGIEWDNGSSILCNAVRNDGISTGRINTDSIIATQGAGNYAAAICAEYLGGGFGDWFLPSKYELNLLYLQKTVVGGFSNNVYWSSSEMDFSLVWTQSFNAGFQNVLAKNFTSYVRAVRAF